MCKLSAYEMTRDGKMVVVLADSYIPQHSIKVFDLRSLLYSYKPVFGSCLLRLWQHIVIVYDNDNIYAS